MYCPCGNQEPHDHSQEEEKILATVSKEILRYLIVHGPMPAQTTITYANICLQAGQSIPLKLFRPPTDGDRLDSDSFPSRFFFESGNIIVVGDEDSKIVPSDLDEFGHIQRDLKK